MKKIYAASLAVIFLATSLFAQHSDLYNQQKKEEYKEFLKNHEYKNRPHYTKEQLKAIPKKDRPDLANELNVLQTLDPALGYVPKDALIIAHKKTDLLVQQNKTAIPGITWTERGPNNFGGRTRALMWDPNDGTGRTVFAGGVAGGLWRNTNITSSSTQWTPINDFWDNLAVTTIAYDPTTTTTFYAGTGEGFFNIDAVAGGGIWKSTNGGASWSHLSSTSVYSYITKIVVASNGDVYASTNGSGIIRSTNGGSSWTKVLGSGVGASTNRAADIEIGADGTLYAALGIFSTDGVYSSTNGTTWTKLNTGSNGFPTTGIRRIELGCAPNNANVIYALVQGSGNGILAIYKSTDKGANWSTLALPNDADTGIPASDFTRSQAWYDLSVDVDPNNSNTLFVGGIDLFKSTNGGSSWSQVSHWYGGFGFQEVHADQHVAVYKPGSSTEIIFGHDGGVSYSSNANASMPTISARNNGYNVTQFYAAAINGASGSNNMLAGAQDNGTHKFTTAGISSTTEVTGGDGAFCHIDQSNGNNQISQYVYNVVYRTTNNWSSGTSQISNDQTTGLFINPSDYDDKEDIYYSGFANGSSLRLKRIASPFGAATSGTVTITASLDDVSHISASPYATAGNSTVFVGTDAGDVYKVSNAQGGSPTITNIGSGIPAGNISCIAIGASEQQLLVTLSNYGVVSVWETTNGGSSWTNKEGNLPNMPVRWAMYNPFDYTQAFLATEVGVWSTTDLTAGSVDWSPTNSGLANVRTDMLQYRSADRTIVAATHGRGLYTTVIPLASPPVANFSGTPTTLCAGNTVSFSDLSTNTPTGWTWSFPGGTPSSSTSQNPTITYNTPGTYNVQLIATNANGSDTLLQTNYITVNSCPAPVANFSGTPTTLCAGNTVSFTDLSANTPTGWTWSFPGGTPSSSTSQNPTITYNTPGTYNVQLIATNANGSDTLLQTNYITVNTCGSAPVANFSGTPTTLCAGNTVNFTDLSTNTPTGWTWSFPGGTPSSSTSQNPTVTYNTAGTYNVQLIATNANGSDTLLQTNYITVNNCGTTKLINAHCGITLPDYTTYIICDYVPSADQYEYEISNVGLGFNQTVIRNYQWRFLYIKDVPGILSGTTYNIRVRARVGGVYGSYGVVCQVTTPSGTQSTQLRSSDCGIVMTSYTNYIMCDYYANATEYEYEFVNTGLGYNQTIVRQSAYRFVYVNEVPGIQNSTTYDVRVRAKVGGVYTSYGSVCQVTTPAGGLTTKLVNSDCGIVMSSFSNYILCDQVPNATRYQYEFVNTGLGFNQVMTRNYQWRFVYVNNVPGIQLNTTYDVRVRAEVGGVYTSYGPVCQITTPNSFRISGGDENSEEPHILTEDINLSIFPNPNNGTNFTIDIAGVNDKKMTTVKIVDLLGKEIMRKEINTSNGSATEKFNFESQLQSGVYLIVLQNGEEQLTKKLVVRSNYHQF